MAYFLDFIQLQYILITFSFAFSAFENLPKISVSFKMVQNFESSDLEIAKIETVNIEDIYWLPTKSSND